MLAVDVARLERALAADDARFAARPLAGGYWQDEGRLPFGVARRLLGLEDDLAHRRAVEAFWRSQPRRPLDERALFVEERTRAQRLLTELEGRAPTPERAGQIALLRGVLALVAAPEEGDRRALVVAAADNFRRAVVADPRLDDAKFNLEAILRNSQNTIGSGEGTGGGGGRKGTEFGGAAVSRTGEGY